MECNKIVRQEYVLKLSPSDAVIVKDALDFCLKNRPVTTDNKDTKELIKILSNAGVGVLTRGATTKLLSEGVYGPLPTKIEDFKDPVKFPGNLLKTKTIPNYTRDIIGHPPPSFTEDDNRK